MNTDEIRQDLESLKAELEEINSTGHFNEEELTEELDILVSEKTIGQDYSEHSEFIRKCMTIAGIVVMVFIIVQYIALFYLINKFVEHASKNATVILTSFIASTFGETIIIAKVMADSVFQNDHQNREAEKEKNI